MRSITICPATGNCRNAVRLESRSAENRILISRVIAEPWQNRSLCPESASAVDPELDAARNDKTHEIAPDLAYRRLGIVNVVFFGRPGAGDRQWVLVDTGIPGTKGLIKGAAEERFGPDARPAAIVMTHGHFDHIGALEDLAEEWDAPVYAHPLEHPYLDGKASYPPGDPSVGGGAMAALARFYPRGPVNVAARLKSLPEDGSVPGMPGWRWLHTPGHSVGHVSFWRESDRAIIAGDAFVTTDQESAYAVAVQKAQMHGPPMYYTVEWDKAKVLGREAGRPGTGPRHHRPWRSDARS